MLIAAKSSSKGEPGKPKPDSTKKVHVPKSVIQNFLVACDDNSKQGIETLGMLCGKDTNSCLKITHVIIPKQTGTRNTCTPYDNEEERTKFQLENDLVTIGWIHTHPTHDCFLSSIDVHSQFAHQKTLVEAVAVVCSLRKNVTKIYRLTDDGMNIIKDCKLEDFHEHNTDTALYATAKHVVLKDYLATVVDLRYD